MLGGKRKDGAEEPASRWEEAPKSPREEAPDGSRPGPGKEGELSTFVGKGTEFVGKLTFDGKVLIDGNVQGEVFSQGTLQIGPSAQIKASINVDTCMIRGTVHGNVVASKRLELHKPARVYGDIRTPSLVLEAGVVFEGNCKMEDLNSKTKPAVKTPPPKAESAGFSEIKL